MRHVPKTPRPAVLFMLAASLVGVSAVVPAVLPSTAVALPSPIDQQVDVTNTLANGASMTLTDELVSNNRKYRLKLIGDGNLVVFKPDWEPAWYSNTGGKLANKVTMQTDGNLVMTKDDNPVWSTETSVGSGGSSTVARLMNSGSLQVIRSGKVVWSTPPASDDPETDPTTTPPRPTSSKPTTSPRPTTTSARPTTTSARPTTPPRPTTTRPVPTSTTWEPEPTVTSSTRPPRPTSTRPTSTKPVPTTTTQEPEPTTTRPPRPTSGRPTSTRPTSTKPVPTTTAVPTTTQEPDPTEEPVPTTTPVPSTTKPVPTTTAPPSDATLGDKVARWAKLQIGKPFMPGASGPDSWGTVELVRAAWKQSGITLPATMQDIYDQGTKVAFDDRRPGDIIVYDAPISGVNHLAVYVGDDRLVEARPIAGVHITLVYDTQRMPVVIRPDAPALAAPGRPGLF